MSPADKGLVGESVPLLPRLESVKVKRGASVSGAVLNVSTSIIGAGIMSIPETLKVLGVVPALFLIVAVAVLADVSVEFLMRFTSSGKTTTYAGVMGEAFGPLGSIAVQICVLVTNLGCLIVFLIIIGDVLAGDQQEAAVHLGVLREWFGIHWWNSRAVSLLFVVNFVLLPLVLFRRVESLRFSSAVAVFLAALFVGISSTMAIAAVLRGKTETPRMFPELDSHAGSFFRLFTAVPVIVTAFTFHFNVHPIGYELDKPSDMIAAVRISLLLCSAIYFSIGLFGYLLFGNSIMPDILVNFDRSSGSSPIWSSLNDAVRVAYALHLMLVFPLVNFSLRANMDELVFKGAAPLGTRTSRYLLLTFVLLGISYVAAIAIPNIWYLFQFVGSTSAVCLAFIFPGAIALRDVQGVSSSKDKILAAIMLILAVVTSSIAVSTNLNIL